MSEGANVMITPEGWQPARVRLVHPDLETRLDMMEIIKKIIFIRPMRIEDVDHTTLEQYREGGCDSNTFYLVADRLGMYSGFPGIACEHQILTD